MPIREESYDLFGNSQNNVYYADKAFTSGTLTSEVLDLRAPNPAVISEYRVDVKCTVKAVGGTSLVVTVEDSDDGTTFGTPIITGQTVATADLDVGKKLLDSRLPVSCKRFIRVKVTANGTFSAGKVFGNVYPVF